MAIITRWTVKADLKELGRKQRNFAARMKRRDARIEKEKHSYNSFLIDEMLAGRW